MWNTPRKVGEELQVGIIDAEIIGKSKHRFPNLCCMKISSYHKQRGDSVTLLLDYNNTDEYDKVYISKVFVKTEIPGEPSDKTLKNEQTVADWYKDNEFLKKPNIVYGGTGFFYDKAPPLPPEIEHAFPDYHLYDEWVNDKIDNGKKRSEFTYYLDYSIGYLTRKCFRGCRFCVNRNYRGVVSASPLSEFLDKSRPNLCFLDDNFFGHPDWKDLIQPVINSGKKFQFKQGLDERLLTKDIILAMSKWKYDGDVIFAFDNIEDKLLIMSKLDLIRNTVPQWKKSLKFYVFCGWDKNNKYDDAFWEKDISDLFERITILRAYGAKPYVMRFEKVYESVYSTFYATVSAYCNQPSMFYSFSFRLFSQCYSMKRSDFKKYKTDIDTYLREVGHKGGGWRSVEEISDKFPSISEKYFDIDEHTDLTEYMFSRSAYLECLLGGEESCK